MATDYPTTKYILAYGAWREKLGEEHAAGHLEGSGLGALGWFGFGKGHWGNVGLCIG